ncbi:uncharacterized protein LOC130765955 isoform X1 [Actinidia eriantha]|uniref:uncharacterized protein LOC130765955 isoform X1 n=1 Tax=Actinidia eriantha TaxID=165200 RepID=UPI00258A585B|nr:uncharacterized protein LOC130765955 isoform X1 [Actinidia eriantha]
MMCTCQDMLGLPWHTLAHTLGINGQSSPTSIISSVETIVSHFNSGCYFPSSFSVEIFTDASADDVQPCSFLLENSTPRYVTVLFDEYCRLLFRKLKELYVTSVCNA